jgi:peptidoglycan hydrolase-like protein with peptidoglycan-binding domain
MGELDEVGRLRAYVADLQSALNAHLAGLGSHERLEIDGEWGEHTARAFRRVCRVLGLEPKRNVRTFRLIVGATQQRTPEELARAQADGASYAQRLRHHFAHEPADPSNGDGEVPSGGDAVARAIRAHGGRFEAVVIREARRVRLPIALACAVLEKETGFRNVFGHDAVHNPVKSPPGGVLAVTQDNYRQYLRHRRRGLGNQGVGPMQLTSPFLQDRADQLGGCWQPGPNIRVGLEFLAGNIRRMGLRAGIVAYNGSGPAAQRYGDDVLARARLWEQRLRAARPRRPDPKPKPDHDPTRPAPPARALRTFRLESPAMRGRDVAAFQQLLNERFAAWNIDKRIDVDGEYGPITRRAARQAVYALGMSGTELAHGVTPELRVKLRRPSRRTPDELAHATRRRGWVARLRRQHEGRGAQAALAYARKHLGVVESPPATNRGPLIDRWNRATGTMPGSPWCGNFANACLMAAGFPPEPWLKLCSAIEGNAKAAKGGWQWTKSPRPGDLVLFTVGGAANHVGIVEAVGRGAVVTIEGNTHKDYDPGRFWEGYGVFRRHHPAGKSAIRGYARPPYGR